MKLGNCFEAALELMAENPDLTLVHGLVQHPEKLFYHVHAWCEDNTDKVLDPSQGELIVISKLKYYAAGHIDPKTCSRYSIMQVFRQTTRTGHSGPWNKQLLNHHEAMLKELGV